MTSRTSAGALGRPGLSGSAGDRKAWCASLLSALALSQDGRAARRTDPRWAARRRQVAGFVFDCDGRACTDFAQAARAAGFCPDLRAGPAAGGGRPARSVAVFMDLNDPPVPGGQAAAKRVLTDLAVATGAAWAGRMMAGLVEM